MTGRVLGAYAAKRCPVRAQWDVLRPVEPEPTPEFIAGLGEAGVAFEADVTARLADEIRSRISGDGIVEVTRDRRDPVAREAETSAAMAAGVRVIHGALLPIDRRGRRVAEPDLLIRVGDEPVDGRWRYRPIDVKHHKMIVDGTALPVVVWTLDELADPSARPDLSLDDAERVGRRDGSARDDLLQLAHYHRTLAACGHAPEGPAWGGVLSVEEQVVWYELDRSRWQGGEDGRDSTLDSYDHRFSERLAIVDAATAHRDDPSVRLLVEPVRIAECNGCPWRVHCDSLMRERGDLSLLPRLGRRERDAMMAAGIETIAELAELPDNVGIEGINDGPLDGFVDAARARLGDQIAYRRQGVRAVRVMRADIELDVDMENLDEVYLWGVQVTDRSSTGLFTDGYIPFVSWDEGLTSEGATALFERFWSWLSDVRRRCDEAGLTLAAYCWSGPAAEDRWMRHYAERAGLLDEVAAYLSRPEWVDLEQPFKTRLVTGHGTSLKTVAPMTGFGWRDDDPGGGQSTVWYQNAVDPRLSETERKASRERILAYNEDDVLATLHVRQWITMHTPFPSVRKARPGA